jgi:hypothetical protein
MSRGGATRKLTGVLPMSPDKVRQDVSEAVLSAVDLAVSTKWEAAKNRAESLTGQSTSDKVDRLTSLFSRELGAVGASAGGVAAVPALGTASSIAAAVAEFGYFTLRSGELILTIGALHGHSEATVEEQRAWILTVLVYGTGASEGFTKLAGELGKGLGTKATKKIPMSVLRAINSTAGRTIVTKYGTKRGVVALGRALPFGIGMAIGGGANYAGVRLMAKHANKFFTDLPYSTVIIDSPTSDETLTSATSTT